MILSQEPPPPPLSPSKIQPSAIGSQQQQSSQLRNSSSQVTRGAAAAKSKQQQQQQQPRILKSYYRLDALASVSASFSALDAAAAAKATATAKLGSAAESVYSLSSSSGSSSSPAVSSKSNHHNHRSSKQEVVVAPLLFSSQDTESNTATRDSTAASTETTESCSRQRQVAHSSSSSCIAFFNQLVTDDTLHRLNAQSAHNSLKRTANSQSLKVVKSTASLKAAPTAPTSSSTDSASSALSLRQSFSSELDTLKKQQQPTTTTTVTKKLTDRFSLKRKKQKDAEKSSRLKAAEQDHVDHHHSAAGVSDEPGARLENSQPPSSSSDSSVSLENLNSDHKSKTAPPKTAMYSTATAAAAAATPVYHGGNGNYYATNTATLSRQQQQQLMLLSKKARKHLPFNQGIKNHGNTCFMNCILQCLFHTSPLADFFITLQFENDMQIIYHQLKQASLSPHASASASSSNGGGFSHFILTKYVYRLLNSLWRNAYNPLYSADLKQLIGSLNPTFAGGNQNDSHELCLWLLDKLSQELTIKTMSVVQPQSPVAKQQSQEEQVSSSAANQEETTTPPPPRSSSSFIEELFQIQFKSSVVCSKCNFKSSKYETDMMLSLPLPQSHHHSQSQSPQKSPQIQPTGGGGGGDQLTRRLRRSVYVHLLLTNLQSIRQLTASAHETSAVDQVDYTSAAVAAAENTNYKSKFYLSDFMTSTSDQDIHSSAASAYALPSAYNLTAVSSQQLSTAAAATTPSPQNAGGAEYRSGSIHARLAFSVLFSLPGNKKELSALPTSPAYCVVNADLGDLRKYVAHTYQLAASDLVFIDLNRVNQTLSDKEPLREHLVKVTHDSGGQRGQWAAASDNEALNDSLCIVELNQLPPKQQQQMPLINIVAINVFHETSDQSSTKRCFPCGMPHVVLINRDCTYSELCKKLLEVQSKYFKDRNFLKYKDLAEKLFSLTLVDSKGGKHEKLSAGDELPLYAECVERALTESVHSSSASSSSPLSQQQTEYIKLNIEWRSYDDITNLLKDIDSAKADFVHRSVHYLSSFDDEHRLAELAHESRQHEDAYHHQRLNRNVHHHQQQHDKSGDDHHQSTGATTLNDCFELFTQREELTDDNSWMCPKCKKQTNAYKNLCISALPPILIIHLKRFFYKSNTSNFKLTTPVWFPVCSLDMGKYLDKCKNSTVTGGHHPRGGDEVDHLMANLTMTAATEHQDTHHQAKPGRPSRPYIYDLFAVCNHKGQNMVNGHYTAFCKNFIDTRWYCYDDANCIPMADMGSQLGNVTANGANGVCTENAYILFYKRRNCMKNEKWWYNFVDRSLYESDEFHRFLNAMDAIERQQQEYQLRLQTTTSKSSRPPATTVTTAASLVMGNGGTGHDYLNSPTRQPITASSEYNYDQDDYGRRAMAPRYEDQVPCQRELTKQAERQYQEDLLRGDRTTGRGGGGGGAYRGPGPSRADAYAYEGLVVNRYDEQVKPHRLLVAKSSESSPSKTMPRNQPPPPPPSQSNSVHQQFLLQQASSTSNLAEAAVNSNSYSTSAASNTRPTLETSKSAHNLLATRPTPSAESPNNVLGSMDSSGQQRRSSNTYMSNEFTPSSSSSSSNNDSIAPTSQQQQQQQQQQELMNFASETPVQKLFRLNNHGVTPEKSILDYPSDNEFLYNQYAYNQPTIKPRTSLTKPANTTGTTGTTTTLPSSNLRYLPVQSVSHQNSNMPTRVGNSFYGQAAPTPHYVVSNFQYQPVAANQQQQGGGVYYSTQTTPNRSGGGGNLLLGPNQAATTLSPVNTSASRYINPGSIETTI